MIVKPFNTYYNVAKIEFTTIRGVDVECYIKGLIAPATVKTFTATGSPLTITMLSGEDTFTRIKGSEATLRLHNLEDFAALKILSEGNKDYILEVKYNGALIWSGYMMPDQWSEPLNSTPYPSEFRFIDGISLLKDIDYADPGGCYYTGYFTDAVILTYCLREIGLNRNFVDQIGIIDENADIESALGTIGEKFKNVEAFRGMTCYQVIDEILKPYVSRVEFYNNKYYFRRINETSETVESIERRMSTAGNLQPVFVSLTNAQNIAAITCANEPASTRVNWVDSVQELYRLPGVRKITINQNYGRKESILPRSLFDACDFDGDQIKQWNQNGVEKYEIDGNTCARFVPLLRPLPGDPPAYTPPAFIEGNTVDQYSTENVTDENKDLFELDIIARNDDFRPVGAGRIGRTIRRGRSQTANGTGVNGIDRPFYQERTDEIEVVSLSGTRVFKINPDVFTDLAGDPINWQNDRLEIVFTDENNVPIGHKVNTPYFIIFRFLSGFAYFNVSPVENPLFFLSIDANDLGKKFKTRWIFTRMRVLVTAPGGGNTRIDNDGLWTGYGFVSVELPLSNLRSDRFFSLALQTTNRLLGALNGVINFRLEKPTGNIMDDENDRAFLIESIRMQIIDTPESNTETIVVNERNKETYTLDIMFAETPIKNNFRNNRLKFYNNFYSLSLSNAPGLQVVSGGEPITLYDYIKNSYIQLLQKHRYALQGRLHSDQVQLLGKIIEEKFTKKYYLSTANQWDVKNHYHDITLHEISNTPEAVVLGDFNDDYNEDFN
jgi:hypothetical protein